MTLNPEILRSAEGDPYLQAEIERLGEKLKNDELGKALAESERYIEESRPEQQDTLLFLRKDIDERIGRYLLTVKELVGVSRMRDFMDVGEYQDRISAKDSRRRSAHSALVDSVVIFFRNSLAEGVRGLEPYARSIIGDPDEARRREKIGELALIYAWNELRKESAAHRGGKIKKERRRAA